MKSIVTFFSLGLLLIVAGAAFGAAPPSGRTFNNSETQPQAPSSQPNFQKLNKALAAKPQATAPDFSKLNRPIARPAAKPNADVAAAAETKTEAAAVAVERTPDA